MSEPTAPERLPLATDDPLRDRLAELCRLLPEAFAEGKLLIFHKGMDAFCRPEIGIHSILNSQ